MTRSSTTIRRSSFRATILLGASTILHGCGNPATPTQPTPDGCVVTTADPTPGSLLTAGVPVTITLAGRCTLSAASTATVVAGGIMLPSASSTPAATRVISRGTTAVSLAIVF